MSQIDSDVQNQKRTPVGTRDEMPRNIVWTQSGVMREVNFDDDYLTYFTAMDCSSCGNPNEARTWDHPQDETLKQIWFWADNHRQIYNAAVERRKSSWAWIGSKFVEMSDEDFEAHPSPYRIMAVVQTGIKSPFINRETYIRLESHRVA